MTGGTPGRRALGDISNKKSDRSFMTPGKAGINIMGSVQKVRADKYRRTEGWNEVTAAY